MKKLNTFALLALAALFVLASCSQNHYARTKRKMTQQTERQPQEQAALVK